MASSGLSSVIGRPLSAGSGFCFLSLAAGGVAATAGKSTPSGRQEQARIKARKDLGVAAIDGKRKRKLDARKFLDFMAFSCAFSGQPASVELDSRRSEEHTSELQSPID